MLYYTIPYHTSKGYAAVCRSVSGLSIGTQFPWEPGKATEHAGGPISDTENDQKGQTSKTVSLMPWIDRDTDIQRYRHTFAPAYRKTYRHTGGHTQSFVSRPTGRHTDRQADIQIHRQTCRHTVRNQKQPDTTRRNQLPPATPDPQGRTAS